MTARWFRHYVGLTTDMKFVGVAHRTKSGVDRVVFVYCSILESAAEKNAGGEYAFNADAIAALVGCETSLIRRIHKDLIAAGILTKTTVSKWQDRQFESDTSRERVQRHRDRKRAQRAVSETEGNESVTLHHRHVTAPEQQSTEAEKNAALLSRARGLTDDELESHIRGAVHEGGGMFRRNSRPKDIAAVRGLLDAGYDLQTEILSTIRAKARGREISSCLYFVEAIRESRVVRLEASAPRRPASGVNARAGPAGDDPDPIRNPMVAAGAKYFEQP